MSRKPRVVTKAIRAPLRSRMALVATVEPCTRSVMAQDRWPAAPRAAKAPMSGLAGVLGTLATSTAVAVDRDKVGEGAAYFDADPH